MQDHFEFLPNSKQIPFPDFLKSFFKKSSNIRKFFPILPFKAKKFSFALEDSSSITTEKSNLDDENLSILEYNESDESHTADDDFLMDKEDTDKENDLLPVHRNETKKSEE